MFSLILLIFSATANMALASEKEVRQDLSKPWSVVLQTRYFFQSHTSYEFGNPLPPNQSPLSRLEFPLNSWWAGASARREFSRFSVGLEAFRNLSRETGGVMADSDWTTMNGRKSEPSIPNHPAGWTPVTWSMAISM